MFFLIPVLVLASCTNLFLETVQISDIVAAPAKYDDKMVQVTGKVTEFLIVLKTGYFVISDGKGSIAVIPAKTFPKVGEEVTVAGTVRNAFIIGYQSLTVIIEK